MLSGLVAHYRVVSTLGAGGMGVVHKAIDTRLNRPVAIKAIPEGLGLETAAVLRLRAEAQSAASLDHPYICKIYELLDTDSGTLIVMEFVEGETLASMLLREGPLPVPLVMRYAAEIAEGLAAAHATGLIHRDVKPSNVMITPHNHVKLLDFGIAHNPATASGTSTTQSMQTRPGSVAGSPFYMAPEQALGRTLDGRTDVFSLGALLFECLTGKLPFEGTTRDAYVLDMLTGRPRSLVGLAPHVPQPIADLVASCLDRNPELRPDAASVAAYLRAEAPTGSTDRFFIPQRRSWKRMALVSLLFLALAVPAAWGIYRWWVPVAAPGLGRQEALITSGSEDFDPRISPDGKWVSFLSNTDGATRLFVTSSRTAEPQPLTDPSITPLTHVWSPGGDEIAVLVRTAESTFVRVISAPVGGVLRKSIDLRERPVFPSGGVRLLRWVDSSLFLSTSRPELWRVDLQTGALEDLSAKLTLPVDPVINFDVSPDGRRFLLAGSLNGQRDLWMGDLSGGGTTRLTDDAHTERNPVWSHHADTIVFQSTESGQLDLWKLEVRTGQRQQLTSGQTEEVFGDDSAAGDVGTFQLISERSNLWMWQQGSADAEVTSDALSDFAPTLAGGLVAFQRSSPSLPLGHRLFDARIVQGKLDGSSVGADVRVLDDGFAPRLSPDGARLAYFQWPSRSNIQMVLRVRDIATGQSFTIAEPAYVSQMAEPLGWATPGVAWNPKSSELYFVGWSEEGYTLHGVDADVAKRKPHDPGSSPHLSRVLAKSKAREELTNLYVAPDGTRLRYLHFDARTNKPDRKLELHEVELKTGSDRVIRTEPWPQGRSVFHVGWMRRGTSSVMVDEIRRSGTVNISEVTDTASRQIASVQGGIPATARLDADRQILYMTRRIGSIQNIVGISLLTGELRQLTSNRRQGVSYSDLDVRADGALLYAVDQRSSDIWIIR